MLGASAPVGGCTLKEIDKVLDTFISMLPNIGYVLDNGGLEPSNSLGELVD